MKMKIRLCDIKEETYFVGITVGDLFRFCLELILLFSKDAFN